MPSGAIRVRPARAGDAPAVARVHVESWREAYRDLLPADLLASLDVVERERRWRQVLDAPDPGVSTWVAETSGVIGFATAGPSRDDDGDGDGELYAIYVHPAHWGTGAGHALHDQAVELLGTYPSSTLWVLEGNDRALRFYSEHGWAPDGRTKMGRRGHARFPELRCRRDA